MARSFSTCFDTFKPKNSFIFPGLKEKTLFAAYPFSTLCEEKYLRRKYPASAKLKELEVIFKSKPRRFGLLLLITDYFYKQIFKILSLKNEFRPIFSELAKS